MLAVVLYVNPVTIICNPDIISKISTIITNFYFDNFSIIFFPVQLPKIIAIPINSP